jgi:hypothetical protein
LQQRRRKLVVEILAEMVANFFVESVAQNRYTRLALAGLVIVLVLVLVYGAVVLFRG